MREITNYVTTAIAEGWQPYGYQFVSDGYIYQPMVKYKKEQEWH